MNIPKLRFREFNDIWKESKLRDFTNVLMCKRIFANQTSESYEVPFYKIGTIGGTPDTFISRELFEEYKSKYNYPRTGEILITCSGTVGKCIIFNGEDSYFQDSNIVWLDNPNNVVNNNFLYYVLSNVDWSRLNSTTIVRIYGDNLRQLKIKYPTEKEQIKIINTLSLLDKKIELQSKKIEDLKLFTKNTISNELNNLQNYNIFKFKDICNIQTGKSNTQDKCDDGIYPFYIRSENIERSNNYIFDCEAVLTIGDGNIGKVFFYENGKFDCHQRVYVLNNFKNVLGKYVYYYFSAFFYKRAMSMSAKNTVDSVRMEMISDMIIKVPQENEQIKMINLFSSLDKKLGLEQNKLDKLQELKKGLMQNMFV